MKGSLCAAFLSLAVVVACSAPSIDQPKNASAKRPLQQPAHRLLSPARYVLTQQAGVVFDAAGQGSAIARKEPALYDGTRLMLQGGILLDVIPSPEPLRGFRSVPERLGGGFVLWSDTRLYKADDFLGDLVPFADVGASGGVRPYLSSIILRTSRGLMELDSKSHQLRKVEIPGLVDAIAVDDQHAVRLDALGRATVTVDGGKSWEDLYATRGVLVSSLMEVGSDVVFTDAYHGAQVRLTSQGLVDPPQDTYGSRRFGPERQLTMPPVLSPLRNSSTSRNLAPEFLDLGAALGTLLPGGNILVAPQESVSLISATTVRPVADEDLLNMDPQYAHCQPTQVGNDVLLACVHKAAHVLHFDEKLSSPKLDATFPGAGAFVAGQGDSFGFLGHCGQMPPSIDDFRLPTKASSAEPEQQTVASWISPTAPPPTATPIAPESPPPPEAPETPQLDDARLCLRVNQTSWIEKRLTGEDTKNLYRFIPGRYGKATALLLVEDDQANDEPLRKEDADNHDAPRKPEQPPDPPLRDNTAEMTIKGTASSGSPKAASTPPKPVSSSQKPDTVAPTPITAQPASTSAFSESLRIIRVRFNEPALKGAVFPAVLDPTKSPRLIDTDFWEDEDGSIRGWVHLPDSNDQEVNHPSSDDSSAKGDKPYPVSTRRGGRAAGIRIDPNGKVTVYPLPDKVQSMVYGGPYAFAMATSDDDKTSYFESTDGGQSFRAVQGPPVGRLEPPYSDGTPFACSAIGCNLGGQGLVRLGWGGPPPSPEQKAKDPGSSSAPTPSPAPPVVACNLTTSPAVWPPRLPSPPVRSTSRKLLSNSTGDAEVPPWVTLQARPGRPVGLIKDGHFKSSVVIPFDPTARSRTLSVHDKTISSPVGSTAAVLLSPSSTSAVDMMLVFDKKRIRARDTQPRLLPFDYTGQATIAAEVGGNILVLDAAKMSLVLANKDAARMIAKFARGQDVSGIRFTLARRLDKDGLAIVGYSIPSRDVFAGEIDLVRGEVGPSAPLGPLQQIDELDQGDCRGAQLTHRFLADLTVTLRMITKAGKSIYEQGTSAVVMIKANATQACMEGIEIRVPQGETTDVSIVFGNRAAAVVRTGQESERISCRIEEGTREGG